MSSAALVNFDRLEVLTPDSEKAMHPNIDVKVTKGGPFPAAFLFLKYWTQQGECWPKEVRKEQCLTLDCQT